MHRLLLKIHLHKLLLRLSLRQLAPLTGLQATEHPPRLGSCWEEVLYQIRRHLTTHPLLEGRRSDLMSFYVAQSVP